MNRTHGQAASQQFRLVTESPDAGGSGGNLLSLPDEVSFLHAPAHGTPRLLTQSPELFHDVLILETLSTGQGGRRLLVLNPARGLLQVKGQPVPRIAVLREGDDFTLNHGPRFHLTIFQQRRIGPPDAAMLGKQCPICRVAFTSRSNIYFCPCGGGIHFESAEEEIGVLDCVPLCENGLCPACHRQPISTQDGYGWFPELLHE